MTRDRRWYAATVSDWDFYPCTIDDRPASIFVDLEFARIGPPVGADTHFIARIAMLDLGPHGMGTLEEADTLYALEEKLEEKLAVHEIALVGRIRTHGVWQMSFYGPASARASFQVEAPDRVVTIEIVHDPAWTYYEQTLSPSLERRQWILDRRVVEELERRGDPLVVPRIIDHWAYFATAEARDSYLAAAAEDGFVAADADATDDASFVARVAREDRVDLDTIHAAVMVLVEHAVSRRGCYDGWECPVIVDN